MMWITSLAAGAAIGLLWLGALWFCVRRLDMDLRQGKTSSLLASARSTPVRLIVAGAAFSALGIYGPRAILVALAGFWLVRSCVLWRFLQRKSHAG